MKYVVLLLLFSLESFVTNAQYLPSEKDTLNYRMVGFTTQPDSNATSYQFEIAAGINNNEVYFSKNTIIKTISAQNRIIEVLPDFGKPYTWRVTYLNKKNKPISKTALRHFVVGKSMFTDTAQYRLRVISNKIAGKELWVLADGTKCLYDINGNAVWYMPVIPGVITEGGTVRDMKFTRNHTITFLTNNGGYEIDYDGNILWRTPAKSTVSGDSSEHFHHELTKLSNSHYLIAGKEEILQEVPEFADVSALQNDKSVEKKGAAYYKHITSGTIIEYDSTGKVVWHLKLAQYFDSNDYFTRKLPSGEYYSDTYFNSFYLDETTNQLYLSFRNLNRILKVQYPSGKLLAQYGTTGSYKKSPPLFTAQHCIRIDDKGDMYLLNNGAEKGKTGISSIVVFKPTDTGTINKLWEFPCNIDNLAPTMAENGGGVNMLNDGSILAAMASAGRIFIVDPEKEVLWNALSETHTNIDRWLPFAQYRACGIEGKDNIEKLVFHH